MTRTAIRLAASKQLAGAYRDLLRAPWTEATAERVIRLLRGQLQLSGWAIVFPWERPKKARPAGSLAPMPIPATASDHLREYLEMTNQRLVAPLPREMPRDESDDTEDTARLAAQARELLFLQSHADLEGASDAFRDLQSILFSCCLQFILPELARSGKQAEHDVLLNVLSAHASGAWTDQPAHAFFLQSQVTDYVGDSARTRDLLWQSLALTPADSHEYMTKVQALWGHLVEHQRNEEAEAFLWDLHWRAPFEHVQEIREMLRAMLSAPTFVAESPRRASRRPRG